DVWQTALATGQFFGSGIDLQDGFIHLSGRDQVVETAARHFAGQSNLVLVAIAEATLGETLRWEPSRGGALFPHVYGSIDTSTVLWVKPLPLGPDGTHQFPSLLQAKSQVTAFPAADPASALAHFERRLSFETDCWDIQHSIQHDVANFVLLDVRLPQHYAKGHVPTAINLPVAEIRSNTLPPLSPGGIYVVYCAGQHCNGANKAAIRITKLGLPVKEMLGGALGWVNEGFQLVIPE
ncbi:MAG: DUF952 domain-containing protein, partial [Planctomycetota bacterium]